MNTKTVLGAIMDLWATLRGENAFVKEIILDEESYTRLEWELWEKQDVVIGRSKTRELTVCGIIIRKERHGKL